APNAAPVDAGPGAPSGPHGGIPERRPSVGTPAVPVDRGPNGPGVTAIAAPVAAAVAALVGSWVGRVGRVGPGLGGTPTGPAGTVVSVPGVGGRGPRRLAPGARRLAGARRPVGTASRHRDLHRHRPARPARSAAGVVGRVAAHRGRPHRRGSAVRRSPARAAGGRSPLTGRPRPEVPIGPGAGNPAAVAVVQPGMDRLRPLLALLVVATAAACAGDRDETIVDDDPWVEEPEPRAPGTPVPAEPVALVDVHHAGGHLPGAPTAVLVDEHDRMAYPGWFAADHPDAAEDIADVLAAPDP